MIPWSMADSVWPCRVMCEGCGAPLDGQAWQPHEGIVEGQACSCGRVNHQSALGPRLGKREFEAIGRDTKWQAFENAWCGRDPWYWMVNYVVTVDEHWTEKGLTGPYNRFPGRPQLRSYMQTLLAYPLTAWPKSRQQMLTWLVASSMLGMAMFVPATLCLVQSKVGRDAVAVLKRISGVLEEIGRFAPWMMPALEGRSLGKDDGYIALANGSTLRAAPQGAHNVQSHTPTWLFLDEVQQQDEAEEAFYQALPAVQRITLVGSAEFCWFWSDLLPDRASRAKGVA